MDRQTLALLIPLFALSIPIAAVIMSGLVKVARYRAMGTGGDTTARVEALEQELGVLRQELSETQDRLDFAERLLARPDGAPREGA